MISEVQATSSMAAIRLLSASIELSGAYFMFRSNSLNDAFRVNALLCLIGPAVLTATTAVGLAGMLGKVPLWKLATIGLGSGLILFATTK